jgi:hypothetical protein
MYAVEIRSDGIRFIKIGRGIQVIMTFYLSNTNGCNVGITDGKGLPIAPLRWAQVP